MSNVILLIAARAFLMILAEDEYHVLTHQKLLFVQYERLLVRIHDTRVEDLTPTYALGFADALYKGANIYRRMDTDQSRGMALRYHHKAFAIRKQYLHKNAVEIAHSYVGLGATYNELRGSENNTWAIEYYRAALQIYERYGEEHKRHIASTLSKLANAYRDLGDDNISVAIDYLDAALAMFATLDNDTYSQRERAKILYNQGINYHRLGGVTNNEVAIALLHQARQIFQLLRDNARYALTLSYLGMVMAEIGAEYHDAAINYLQEALQIQKEIYHSDDHPEVVKTASRLEAAKELSL